MDELPREARALLALAQDAHDPPADGARDRVRRGVLLAAAAGGAALSTKAVASGASSALKSSLFASTGAKMLLAGSALVLASAVTVVAPLLSERAARTPTPTAAPRAVEHQPVAAPLPVVAVEAAAQPAEVNQPMQAATEQAAATALRKSGHGGTRPWLEAEMRLLASASAALAGHELRVAQKKLAEHRRLYPHGQLASEREGLLTLTLCTRGGAKARKRARAFLQKQPDAVLSARIRSACLLEEP